MQPGGCTKGEKSRGEGEDPTPGTAGARQLFPQQQKTLEAARAARRRWRVRQVRASRYSYGPAEQTAHAAAWAGAVLGTALRRTINCAARPCATALMHTTVLRRRSGTGERPASVPPPSEKPITKYIHAWLSCQRRLN